VFQSVSQSCDEVGLLKGVKLELGTRFRNVLRRLAGGPITVIDGEPWSSSSFFDWYVIQ
jgi:hypothetical protein